jgi:thiamine-monophosphate kinase
MARRAKSHESAEDRLIARYFRPLARHPGAFALGDDAAAVTPQPGHDIVLKADAIIGGVHFFHDDTPAGVAKKALRVNLSDLAAKGATPIGFLLSLALPSSIGPHWLKDFARGLGTDAKHFGCPLLGGDTDRTPGPVTISIAAFGTLPRGSMVRRAGARPGDRILITGTIGDAALGLALRRRYDVAKEWQLKREHRHYLIERYRLPQPRNALAATLRKFASASMDISDGLVGDLSKLCRASGVDAEIEAARVPLSPAARAVLAAKPKLIETMLTGGDDYEIVCAVAPGKVPRFCAAAATAGVAVCEVGKVVKGEGHAHFLNQKGRPMAFAHPSFSHF